MLKLRLFLSLKPGRCFIGRLRRLGNMPLNRPSLLL